MATVALAFIALVAVGYWASQAVVHRPSASPGSSATTVVEFSGDGDMTTEPFTVAEGWEIRWLNQGRMFSMALKDGSTRDLMSRGEPGSGTTVPRGSGTYRLVIRAKGKWSVQIRQP
jgi:hypothetical protein